VSKQLPAGMEFKRHKGWPPCAAADLKLVGVGREPLILAIPDLYDTEVLAPCAKGHDAVPRSEAEHPFPGGVTSMTQAERLRARGGRLPRRANACTSNPCPARHQADSIPAGASENPIRTAGLIATP
jgi:hypothetical protein